MKQGKYMFSEGAGLLCRVTYKNKYSVLNGAWDGKRDGDKFYIEGDKENFLIIKDWKEIDPDSMSLDWQYEWYYRR